MGFVRRSVSAGALCAALMAFPGSLTASADAAPADRIVERMEVVDCLLPGQVKQLGRRMRFIDRRRPARLSAGECETRGGEYTVHDRANDGSSFNVWMPLAMEGDANAQLIVGELSERGANGTPDYAMARLWYERAAGQGNEAAMFNLARVYEQGLGVEADAETASGWLRQAYGLNANRLEDAVRIERMETEIRSLTDTVEGLRDDLEAAEAEKRALEQQLRETEARLQDASAEIATITEALADARRQSASAAAAYEAKLTELESREREFTEVEASVVTRENTIAASVDQLAQRQLDASQRLVAQLANLPTLAAQSARLGALQSQLEDAQARARTLEAEKQAALAAKREIAREAAATRASLKSELDALVARESALATREAALATAMAEVEQSGEVASQALVDQHASIAAEQADLAAQRAAVRAHLDALETARAEQAAREEALASAEAELASQREALAERERDLAAARNEVTEQARALQQDDRNYQEALSGLDDEFAAISAERERLEQERQQLNELREEVSGAAIRMALAKKQLDSRTVEVEQKAAELDERERTAGVQESEIETLRAEAQDARQKLAALEAIISGNTRSVDPGTSRGTIERIVERTDWDIDFGTYHAVLIGNANYDDPNWPDLDTPHNDVNRIGKILREQYGFKTTILIDATREEILGAIEDAGQTLDENDNLMIYYAGHGKYSNDAKTGFWEPVDSVAYGYRNSISAQQINFYLSTLKVRKVLVVSDSCYSGAFAREMVERLEPTAEPNQQRKFYMIQAAKRSRVVMTAGGLKPVADGIGNGHSLFASAFINALLENEDIALSRNLFARIRGNVINSAAQVNLDQEPSFADLVHTGHEGGDFIFVPRA